MVDPGRDTDTFARFRRINGNNAQGRLSPIARYEQTGDGLRGSLSPYYIDPAIRSGLQGLQEERLRFGRKKKLNVVSVSGVRDRLTIDRNRKSRRRTKRRCLQQEGRQEGEEEPRHSGLRSRRKYLAHEDGLLLSQVR